MAEMTETGSALHFAAVTDCGCVVAAITNRVAHHVESLSDMRQWIDDGLTIERLSTEEIRERLQECPHG